MKLVQTGQIINLVSYGEEPTLDTMNMSLEEASVLIHKLLGQQVPAGSAFIEQIIAEWKADPEKSNQFNALILFAEGQIANDLRQRAAQQVTTSRAIKRRKLDRKGTYAPDEVSSEDDAVDEDILSSGEEENDLVLDPVPTRLTSEEKLQQRENLIDLTKAPDGGNQPVAWIQAVKNVKNHTTYSVEYIEALSQTCGIDIAHYPSPEVPILFAYEGGKQPREISFILSILDQHKPSKPCLVEPFVGSARLFLNSDFQDYQIADRDYALIAFYSTVLLSDTLAIQYEEKVTGFIHFYGGEQQLFNQSCEILRSVTEQQLRSWLTSDELGADELVARDNWARSYIFVRNRAERNPRIKPGEVKVVWSPPGDSQKLITREKNALNRLWQKKTSSNIQLHSCEWQQTFREAPNACTIYADPPYAPFTFGAKTENMTDRTYGKSFGWDQQEKLAQLAREKALAGTPVFISNHFTIELLELYKRNKATKIYTYCWKPGASIFACLVSFLPSK